jgi:hypothetical protein
LAGCFREGVLRFVGDAQDKDLHIRFQEAFRELALNPVIRASMSTKGQRLVDGCGAQRVADAIALMCSHNVGKSLCTRSK